MGSSEVHGYRELNAQKIMKYQVQSSFWCLIFFNSSGANHYSALNFSATATTTNKIFLRLEHTVKDTGGLVDYIILKT